MRNIALFLVGLTWFGGVQSHAQELQEAITAADKAISVVHQSLTGVWLAELRRMGPAGPMPPIPTIITFFEDGTSLASPADGTQTATHGIWIRVGDRKFLGTGFFFNFNESRVLTTITKLRVNYQISADGRTITGTTEAVILDPRGRVLATNPGTTVTMTRLRPEIPGDFYDFQARP